MPPLSREVAASIRNAHIKQLAQFAAPTLRDIEDEAPPPELKSNIIDWIDQNRAAITAAQKTRMLRLLSTYHRPSQELRL